MAHELVGRSHYQVTSVSYYTFCARFLYFCSELSGESLQVLGVLKEQTVISVYWGETKSTSYAGHYLAHCTSTG
jgi:hypothetical protein